MQRDPKFMKNKEKFYGLVDGGRPALKSESSTKNKLTVAQKLDTFI
jgi:hypothetical protein